MLYPKEDKENKILLYAVSKNPYTCMTRLHFDRHLYTPGYSITVL